MPKRSSFGRGEVSESVDPKALGKAWRAAEPCDQRVVFDEILGYWIRCGKYLLGQSPVSLKPYAIALNLGSWRWSDGACLCAGHGLLALAEHAMGLSRAKAADRILFLLRAPGQKRYRPRTGAHRPRGSRRQPPEPPRLSRTERPAIDPRTPPPLSPRLWEMLIPASSVASCPGSERRSARCLARNHRGRSPAVTPSTVPEKPIGPDAHPCAPEGLSTRSPRPRPCAT
jgi:hypothetical protein